MFLSLLKVCWIGGVYHMLSASMLLIFLGDGSANQSRLDCKEALPFWVVGAMRTKISHAADFGSTGSIGAVAVKGCTCVDRHMSLCRGV